MVAERPGDHTPDIWGQRLERQTSDQHTLLHENLKSLGIETSTEDLAKLSAYPEVLHSLQTDIEQQKLLNPPLQTELDQIQDTINWYTKSIDANGRNYTYRELRNIYRENEASATEIIANSKVTGDQENDIYDYISATWKTREESSVIATTQQTWWTLSEVKDLWKQQTSNSKQDETISNGGALEDEHIERRDALNNRLAKPVEQIQKLDIKSPDISTLRQQSKDIPELQGASGKDIDSGRYDNVIYADYYERSESEILGQIDDPNKKNQVRGLITNFRDVLGRPGKYDFQEVLNSRSLWADRDKIESLGNTLMEKGYKKEVEWDPRTRTITFENGKGEKRIIETTKNPPEEKIVSWAIEISKPLETPEKNPYTESRENAEANIKKTIDRAEKYPFVGALQDTPEQRKIDDAWRQIVSETDIPIRVNQSQDILDMKLRAVEKLMQEAEKSGEISESKKLEWDIHAVREEKQALDRLLQEYTKLTLRESATREKIGSDRFWEVASQNRNGLSALGMDKAFLDMNELSRFIESGNNAVFWNRLMDRSSVNVYLATEKLTESQYRHLLKNMTAIYSRERWDENILNQDMQTQVRMLRAVEPNGKTRMENTLISLRTKNWDVPLTKERFSSLLHHSEKTAS